MVLTNNAPGNIAIGQLTDDLLANIESLSRDDAVGAVIGLIDHLKFALVNIIEETLSNGGVSKILAPYDLKLLKVQLVTFISGTAGSNDLDFAIDGTPVLTPVVSVDNSEPDGTAKLSADLDIDVAKDSTMEFTYTAATGGGPIFMMIWVQRVGRIGGIGI